MSTDKQAKRFVKKLGRKLTEGDQSLDFEDLKQKFQNTILKLPKGPIKTTIKKNYVHYIKQLWRAIKKSEKLKDSKHVEAKLELPYNTYPQYGLRDAVEKLKKADQKTRQSLGPHLLASVYSDDDLCKEVIDLLNKQESELDKNRKAIEMEKSITLGNPNRTVLHKHMHSFVRKMTIEVEGAILTNSEKRCKKLKKEVVEFVVLARFQNTMVPKSQEMPSFEDLLAAILSLYLDLCIFLARGKDDIKMRVQETLFTLLASLENAEMYLYDVVLQAASVTKDDVEFIFPIYKVLASAS